MDERRGRSHEIALHAALERFLHRFTDHARSIPASQSIPSSSLHKLGDPAESCEPVSDQHLDASTYPRRSPGA